MTTFITQARFTKEGLNGLIAVPEDRAETVGRLIAQVGGKLIAYYLTSGECAEPCGSKSMTAAFRP